MLNRKPIFINAFARGGSNILMNMLLSHPAVCVSSGETHKVFKGTKWDPWWRKIKKRVCYDFTLRLLIGQDFFGPRSYMPRKTVPISLQRYIDRILYYGRFTALRESHNLLKAEGVPYTREELTNCRLLTKGLNAIVFTTDMFRSMYPDAVFFGLIRNGMAIAEGYIRRGGTAARSAEIYNTVVQKMLECKEQMPNYHIVRYEDMVSNPIAFIDQIYVYAHLDVNRLSKIRLQSKKVTDSSGRRNLVKGQDRQVYWYEPDHLSEHIRSDINENQIRRLTDQDKETFRTIAGETMEALGYAA